MAHEIAVRMQALRKARGWSAERLAQAMREQGQDWSRTVVTKLETGRRANITTDELLALAHALEVSPVDLLPAVNPGPRMTFEQSMQVIRERYSDAIEQLKHC